MGEIHFNALCVQLGPSPALYSGEMADLHAVLKKTDSGRLVKFRQNINFQNNNSEFHCLGGD